MSKSSKIFCEYDFLEEDSDQERGLESSEDEIDVILHGTPKQKRKLSRSLSEGSLDVLSSGDEFEKEMEMGLEESMKQHEKQQMESAGNAETAGASSAKSLEVSYEDGKKYYDEVYFDSDDEDGEGSSELKTDGSQTKQARRSQPVQSNDDLFYDPEIDDQNQRWVDNQRSRYIPTFRSRNVVSGNSSAASDGQSASGSRKIQSDGHKSDAILNCPACMTTLCLDCQRHELYPTQYRAMFVLNCIIIRSERLQYKTGQKKNRKWRKKQKASASDRNKGTELAETCDSWGTEEYYHPVKCSECNTEVAVYDADEVYHFFNVLSSIA